MTDWGWVALGYVTMYGLVAAYVGWIATRIRTARRRLDELG